MIGYTELTADVDGARAGAEVAAFFDFDGTTIYGFSFASLLRDRVRRRDMSVAELVRPLPTVVKIARGEADFSELLSQVGETWAGRTPEELEEMGEELFRRDLAHRLYPETCALMTAHRRRDHTVVIASSAPTYQVEAAARSLGVEHLLCTRLEVEDGRLTGKVMEPGMWGDGKALAVKTFAAEHGIDLSRSYAYADGGEDVALMELVGNPRPTNPDSRLARAAEERGWPVQRFESRGRARPGRIARSVASNVSYLSAVATAAAVGVANRSTRDAANVVNWLAPELQLAIAGVTVDVIGHEHLWSSRPAVFLYNHQSPLDSSIVQKLVHRDCGAVAKKELGRFPFAEQLGRAANVVFIDRSNPEQAVAAIKEATEKAFGEGVSMMVAPEGSRQPPGHLGSFKKGAFRMAMDAGVPIVPIVLRNTSQLQGKKDRFTRPGTVEVVVHPPIPVDGWSLDDLDARIAEVRRLYADTLADWPGSTASSRSSGGSGVTEDVEELVERGTG